MYISCHQIPGIKIYDQNGHLVTLLKNVLIDPDNGHILALETTLRSPNLISPQDIISWKRHYLTLGQDYELLFPGDLIRVERLLQTKTPYLLHRKVRTESGQSLGRVVDYSLHVDQFMLASLTAQKTTFFWKKETYLIHQSQIVEIKPQEIIVKDSLIKVPAQSSPEKFALQNSPTLDQALFGPADRTFP